MSATTVEVQPRYTHDCDLCTFLGHYLHWDLYVCGTRNVVARRSSEDSDYLSTTVYPGERAPSGPAPLAIAWHRVKEMSR